MTETLYGTWSPVFQRSRHFWGEVAVGRNKKKSGTGEKGKSFPVHPKFKDRNLTSIDSMKMSGKSLKGPFSGFPGPLKFLSWVDELSLVLCFNVLSKPG